MEVYDLKRWREIVWLLMGWQTSWNNIYLIEVMCIMYMFVNIYNFIAIANLKKNTYECWGYKNKIDNVHVSFTIAS